MESRRSDSSEREARDAAEQVMAGESVDVQAAPGAAAGARAGREA